MSQRFDIEVSSNKFEVVLMQEILLMKKLHCFSLKKNVVSLKNKYKKRKTRVHRDYRLLV
jgi:hypothetical protein